MAVSERSIKQVQLLWGVWLQQFFHLQSNYDQQPHNSIARPLIAAGLQSPGTSTDIRLQMLDLHCSRSTSTVEVQLSLKSMEASGLITLVPAPLAPHISESPKHLVAFFGKKYIGLANATVIDPEVVSSHGGGWKWKSSMGGCNVELLQHTMAPWLVLQEMHSLYVKMRDSAQHNRVSDVYRGSPWLMRRPLSHSNNSSVSRSLAHQQEDLAIDIPAQPPLDIRKENDSLRLLLGSYESHFSRMRQQLQLLLPNGLISRDMDGKGFC